MQYRYLQGRGALNEVADEPAGPPPAPPRRPASLRGRVIPPEVLALLPDSVAHEHTVIPIAAEGETVTVAAADPTDIALADRLSFLMARKVELVAAPRDEI